MGSIVEFNRRRSPGRPARSAAERAARDAAANQSLLILIVVFGCAALAMTAAVVISAAASWAAAIPLLICIFVIALAKIFLADALFYIMIRSDAHAEARAAERGDRRRCGLVIRRPPDPRGGPRRPRHALAGGHIRAIASAQPPAGRIPNPKRR